MQAEHSLLIPSFAFIQEPWNLLGIFLLEAIILKEILQCLREFVVVLLSDEENGLRHNNA